MIENTTSRIRRQKIKTLLHTCPRGVVRVRGIPRGHREVREHVERERHRQSYAFIGSKQVSLRESNWWV